MATVAIWAAHVISKLADLQVPNIDPNGNHKEPLNFKGLKYGSLQKPKYIGWTSPLLSQASWKRCWSLLDTLSGGTPVDGLAGCFEHAPFTDASLADLPWVLPWCVTGAHGRTDCYIHVNLASLADDQPRHSCQPTNGYMISMFANSSGSHAGPES